MTSLARLARLTTIGLAAAALSAASEPLARVAANLVLAPVTVVDRNGKPLMDLRAEDFRVFDGTEQRPILSFWREDAPVSVAIVVDWSGSMRSKLRETLAAVGEVARALDVSDSAALIAFADRPRVLAEFSRDPESLKQYLSAARAEGDTALIDAVYLALQKVRSARGRKALVVISDGADTCSRYSEKDLARLVVESDVQVYTIGIADAAHARNPQRGLHFLQTLSERTGGLHATVRHRAGLATAARGLAAAMKNLYVIGYRPSGRAIPGTWQKIRVAMERPQPVPVRIIARPGYYHP